MNKQEISVVVVLFVVLMAWMFVISPKLFPVQTPPPSAGGTNGVAQVTASQGTQPTDPTAPVVATPAVPAPDSTNVVAVSATVASNMVVEVKETASALDEQFCFLENEKVKYTISSKGGGIKAAELAGHYDGLGEDAKILVLDFEGLPALSMGGLTGLGQISDFVVTSDGKSAQITAEIDGKYRFERQLLLGDSYTVAVTDRVVNITSEVIELPNWYISSGRMGCVEKNESDSEHLSLDTYGMTEKGKDGIKRWKKDFPRLFGAIGGGCSASKIAGNAPMSVNQPIPMSPQWVAPKSKFFTLLLRPETAATSMAVNGWRKTTVDGSFKIDGVAASLVYAAETLDPNQELTRGYTFYAGPKQYQTLKALGHGEEAIMDWGIFRIICRLLLPTLLVIYSVVRNWGVAIILLTFLVRGIFWPVTHKSTESMKRMQELQPQIKELKEKHKGEPQRIQQETMKLYREHKVNPMASCLPMLIQIPVFIALFTVLRSSVEMRHSSFLWIKDLSEPENIPIFGYYLNILPLVMASTMAWQQHLTPSGDAQQKKMMMLMMPLMMLFMLYSMPSALMLYWSTSQIVSIVQLYWQRRRQHSKDKAAGGGVIDVELVETRQMRRRKDK